MEIDSITQLNEISSVVDSDSFHILRSNEYSIFLSYREQARRFKDIYQDVSIIDSFKKEITALVQELKEISSSMLTRSAANSTYATLDYFNAKKEQLLTESTMASLISKYVTKNDALSKAGELRAEARKLADEMTDFGAAAMVGINQSTSQYQVSGPTE